MTFSLTTPSAIDDFFDKRVLQKYNTAGPRYTSYPTAVAFTSDFEQIELEKACDVLSNGESAESVSLYIHIPFCHELCYYCGCNKIVTRHKHKADIYLDYLAKEVKLREYSLQNCIVSDVHLGGGTPNFLSIEQLSRLKEILLTHFNFSTTPEYSIELDPRTVDVEYIVKLYDLGFSRLSFGIQDANKKVQKAINRIQDSEHVKTLVKTARTCGFSSINLDLIYGLPHQTNQTFEQTLALVNDVTPDRVSLFSYAHMPQMFAAQRKIKDEWLPSMTSKFALFRQAIDYLTDIGFDFIGMDHFARPDDKLSIAQQNKTLFRNFQGYTTGIANACIGLGCSAISSVEYIYSQNAKDLKDYYKLLDNGQLPVVKGIVLSEDDAVRRDLIHQLMCNFEVDKTAFSKSHSIDFDNYFFDELESLKTFEEDNLVSNTCTHIKIHDRGRLIVRNICMSFDRYLSQPMHQLRYSRVI